jgi:hypothetical protein
MPRVVPVIEVADYADAIRCGRPHSERHAAFAFMSPAVRAELFVNPFVLALAEKVEIDIAERGRKTFCGAFGLGVFA